MGSEQLLEAYLAHQQTEARPAEPPAPSTAALLDWARRRDQARFDRVGLPRRLADAS